jgi:hypothetical protein
MGQDNHIFGYLWGYQANLYGQSPHYPTGEAVISLALSRRRTGRNSYPDVAPAFPAPSITKIRIDTALNLQ